MNGILSATSFRFNGNNYDIGDNVVITKCKNTKHIGLKGVVNHIYVVSDIHPYFTISLEPSNPEFPNQRNSYSMMIDVDHGFDIQLMQKDYRVELV